MADRLLQAHLLLISSQSMLLMLPLLLLLLRLPAVAGAAASEVIVICSWQEVEGKKLAVERGAGGWERHSRGRKKAWQLSGTCIEASYMNDLRICEAVMQ